MRCSSYPPGFITLHAARRPSGPIRLPHPHLAHPADSQSSHQPIRPDGLGLTTRVDYRRPPGISRETVCICVSGEQRLDLGAQLTIVRAGFIQERTSFVGLPFQSLSHDLLNSCPLLLFFHAFLFSSAWSATLSPQR